MNRKLLFVAILLAVLLVSLASVSAAMAPAPQVIEGEIQPLAEHVLMLKKLVKMLVFCASGMFVLFLGLKAFDMVAPFGLKKEVGEEKNTAAAVVFAAVVVSLGILIHGALTCV